MYKVEETSAKIRLNANELNMPMTETVINDIMKDIDMAGFNRYPETDSQTLRKAYASLMSVDDTEVIVGNGSDEILDILYKTYTTYGDKVMALSPSFVMYEIVSSVYKCEFVPFILPDYDGFDTDAFIKAIETEKPRMIFLCNPNNPTGLLIPKADIKRILEATDAVVILDEAYGEFISDNFLDYSLIDERNNYDNLIILKTLSKAYGLAGLRVGFGIASSKNVSMMAEKKYPYNVSLFSQEFALGLVNRANEPFFKERISKTIANRDVFIEKLNAIKGIKSFPTAANFVWIYAPEIPLKAICDSAGIQIRVFTNDSLNGYARISIGTESEMNEFLKTIKEAI